MGNVDINVETGDTMVVIERKTQEISNSIMDQLIAYRKAKKLTQQDIADKTGMKRANVARIEGKKYTPTIEVLMRYADSMGYTIEMNLVEKKDNE